MAGSVPVWETPHRAQQRAEQTLTAATTGEGSHAASFETALAYQNTRNQPQGEPPQEFGFGDLVDMINPLQHVPVVGHLYRKMTGDTIKPIAQIIGGAVFGGPLGAASGLVNTIVREETGKDLTGNALALAQSDEQIEWRKPRSQQMAQENPETRLSRASRDIETAAYRDLPPSLMGFADIKTPEAGPEPVRKRSRYND